MRQIITLPIISFNEFHDVNQINQLITLICNKLEKKLTANYNKQEASKTDEKRKKTQQEIDKNFGALRFLSFLDFVRHENQDGNSWSGDVYYCAKTMRNLEHRPQDKRASNVIIQKKNQKLEIKIDDATSDSEFTQRLYDSFCALDNSTKLSLDNSMELSSFSDSSNPLEIDDKSGTQGDDKDTTPPLQSQGSGSGFKKHLQSLQSLFSFSETAAQIDSPDTPKTPQPK